MGTLLASRLKARLIDMGAGYVKVGQLLASRPDLVGDDAALELSSLNDGVPPMDFGVVRGICDAEHRGLMDAGSLVEAPVAAGSVGQVHLAKVRGRTVVVKVIRPDAVETSMRVLRRVRDAAFWSPGIRRAVTEMEGMLRSETDMGREADMMRFFRGAAEDVRIPRIVSAAPRSILMEYLPATRPVTRDATLTLLRGVVGAMFRSGVVYCDLHAGNYGQDAAGRPVLWDFGSCVRLPPMSFKKIVHGVFSRERGILLDGVVECGLFDGDVASLRSFCDQLVAFSETSDLPAMLLGVSTSGLSSTARGTALVRCITLVDAACREYTPRIEMLELLSGVIRDSSMDPEWLVLQLVYKSWSDVSGRH